MATRKPNKLSTIASQLLSTVLRVVKRLAAPGAGPKVGIV